MNPSTSNADFNSIKVRLKQSIQHLSSVLVEYDFNSIKVRLKQQIRTYLLSITHFNSIKVRLKLQKKADEYYNEEFQFHKGAIKTNINEATMSNYLHFNSIKVRLKLNINEATMSNYLQFQFHKGAIKTYQRSYYVELSAISIP